MLIQSRPVSCAAYVFLFTVCFFAQAASAQNTDQSNIRLTKLSSMFRLNIMSEVYINYCDPRGVLDSGDYFYTNIFATRNVLERELRQERQYLTRDQAKRAVRKRGLELASDAYANLSQRGCDSPYVERVLEHIRKIGRLRTSVFIQYLKNIEHK